MSCSPASSRWPASFLPFSITLPAAMNSAEPPSTVEREPLVPMPKATRSVSPSMYCTSSGSMPSRSFRICLNMVSWPWPWFLVPISSAAVPLGLKRISAYSGCAVPAACSMALTMPSRAAGRASSTPRARLRSPPRRRASAPCPCSSRTRRNRRTARPGSDRAAPIRPACSCAASSMRSTPSSRAASSISRSIR